MFVQRELLCGKDTPLATPRSSRAENSSGRCHRAVLWQGSSVGFQRWGLNAAAVIKSKQPAGGTPICLSVLSFSRLGSGWGAAWCWGEHLSPGFHIPFVFAWLPGGVLEVVVPCWPAAGHPCPAAPGSGPLAAAAPSQPGGQRGGSGASPVPAPAPALVDKGNAASKAAYGGGEPPQVAARHTQVTSP